MGVAIALHEEMTFSEGAITSGGWLTYPILTMGKMPEIKVVLAHLPKRAFTAKDQKAPTPSPHPLSPPLSSMRRANPGAAPLSTRSM